MIMESPYQQQTPTRHKPIRHKRTRSVGSMNTSRSSMNGSLSSLFQNLNPAHHLTKKIVKKAATVVDNYVTQLTNRSPYLLSCDASSSFEEKSTTANPSIPLLDRSEIQLGKLLGEGGFCGVYEIVSITSSKDATDDGEQELTPSTVVIKQLRKRLAKNPPQFTLAAADLVVEAQYLSRLCHPHIVPVRGMTRGGVQPMKETGRFDAYFLVMDKLESTLDQRIQRWQRGTEIAPSYDQKLAYAMQMAQALHYLHQRRIVFRDCKPRNVGFRADNGMLQLFDFHLCRELPPPRERTIAPEEEKVEDGEEGDSDEEEEEEQEDPDDYYHMTKVGTRRYCAVEMYISGRYNEKIDVYSWAMTGKYFGGGMHTVRTGKEILRSGSPIKHVPISHSVYEMIAHAKPFASLTDADHQEFVCSQGKRPNAKPFLQHCDQPANGQNNPLLTLVREAWEQYVRYRVDIGTVVEGMEEIIEERQQHQAVTAAEKEKDLTGSVVSATTATVAESDHDDIESPMHPHSSLTNGISPPATPGNNNAKEDILNDEDNTDAEATRETEDDADSMSSLLVVDIGVPGTRQSIEPSLGTTSISEQSSRWDDSINTNEVELVGEQSLSTIAFDEFLRPRHRGSVSEASSPSSSASHMHRGQDCTASVAATLSPPSLHTGKMKSHSIAYLPDSMALPTTTLQRIVSMNLDDEDDEEDDELKAIFGK